MRASAPLSLVCFAILASPPAVSFAAGSADTGRRAACREQALAEGLRSEEVILDYVHECLDNPASTKQSGVPSSGVSSDTAGSAANAPGPGPAARAD